MDNYIVGIHAAWRGEQLGFAAFSARANAQQDKIFMEMWRTLAQLELVTGERMAKVLRFHGEHIDNDTPFDQQSEAFQSYLRLSHADVIAYMRGRVASALGRFEELLAIAPKQDMVDVQFLVDHELALITFVEREAAGEPDSLCDVRRLLSY
ncbi:MAG: hypothetical protein AAF542_22240 [Pseudomonadota bacterium]